MFCIAPSSPPASLTDTAAEDYFVLCSKSLSTAMEMNQTGAMARPRDIGKSDYAMFCLSLVAILLPTLTVSSPVRALFGAWR